MQQARFRTLLVACCLMVLAVSAKTAAAKTICVARFGFGGCSTTIQAAVDKAAPYDVILVAPGIYKEEVTVGKPLSILGAGADVSIIDATNLAHGVFIDGFDNSGLHHVTLAGLTVKKAQFEGILVVSAFDVTIRDSNILDNDQSSGLEFTGATEGCPNQPGNGIYENDETGDCGGAIHFIGVWGSVVSGNLISGNADGLLISDETGESHDNVVENNNVTNNPLECGIVLASHPPTGHTTAPFAPHFGVNRNLVTGNISNANGVQVGGSGVGLFSDGNGPGTVSGNLVIRNKLTNNGLGGVALHSHVGPAFGLPADTFDGNKIIGNYISGNHADTDDTATPGTVGININSGSGGSPVRGTVISGNVILDEDVDVAVNTPAFVEVNLNDLDGGKTGVADVCAYDNASICGGSIGAGNNFWGCAAGPGKDRCSTVSGTDIDFVPWLVKPIPGQFF